MLVLTRNASGVFFVRLRKGKLNFDTGKYLKGKMRKKYHFDTDGLFQLTIIN